MSRGRGYSHAHKHAASNPSLARLPFILRNVSPSAAKQAAGWQGGGERRGKVAEALIVNDKQPNIKKAPSIQNFE